MEQDKVNRSTMDLIDAVRVIFEAEAAEDTASAPPLQRVLALLPELRPDSDRPVPRARRQISIPVIRRSQERPPPTHSLSRDR